MGSTVCRAVAADPELELVGAIDPHHSGLDLRHATGVDVPTCTSTPTRRRCSAAGVEVVVDFTTLDAARAQPGVGGRATGSTPWWAPPGSPTTTTSGSGRRSPAATAWSPPTSPSGPC